MRDAYVVNATTPTMLQDTNLGANLDANLQATVSVNSTPQYCLKMTLFYRLILASIAAIATTLISLVATPVFADPPARVGRVAYVEGDVSFYSNKADGWRPARLNFPVSNKNSVWTNPNSRAEVRIGSSVARLDADSVVDFTTVDDSRTQLFVQRGVLNVRLRSYPQGTDSINRVETNLADTFRVETSEGTAILQSNGRYRITAAQDKNETRVSVFAGLARFDNGNAVLNIDAGKALVIRSINGAPSFVFETAAEIAFDRWASERDVNWDNIHQRYANERNISPRMTGYEDLDRYGDWSDDREYGRLWTPRIVISGWAPYRFGAWSYVQPWGWTWIDDAQWGFAPFHYGRWVHRSQRWYWAPGAYRYRPVYAPALVGWAGRGNWNVSLTIGGGYRGDVSWFPLAPREYYVPHYATNNTYIRNINNVTNNITVINAPTTFINQVPGTTVVNNTVMVNGEPVWRNRTNGTNSANNPVVNNNSATISLRKPALDRRAAEVNSAGAVLPPIEVTSMPPPTPSTALNVRQQQQPAFSPSPTPLQVTGEAPREVYRREARPINVPNTSAQQQTTGEAPWPSQRNIQSSQNKPAPAPDSHSRDVLLSPPAAQPTLPFARPIKPNPSSRTTMTPPQTSISLAGEQPVSPFLHNAQPAPRYDAANQEKPPTLISNSFNNEAGEARISIDSSSTQRMQRNERVERQPRAFNNNSVGEASAASGVSVTSSNGELRPRINKPNAAPPAAPAIEAEAKRGALKENGGKIGRAYQEEGANR